MALPFFFATDTNCYAQDPVAAGEFIGALNTKNFANDIELVDSQKQTIKELFAQLANTRSALGEQKRLDFSNAPAGDRR